MDWSMNVLKTWLKLPLSSSLLKSRASRARVVILGQLASEIFSSIEAEMSAAMIYILERREARAKYYSPGTSANIEDERVVSDREQAVGELKKARGR